MRKARVSVWVLACVLAFAPGEARADGGSPGAEAAETQPGRPAAVPGDESLQTQPGQPAAKPGDPNKTAADKGPAGWFSRINPFAPIVRLEETQKPEPEPTAAPAPLAEPSKAAAAARAAEPPRPVLLKLNGILFSTRMPVALINDGIVGVGDAVEGYRIASIGPDLVTAEKQGVRYVLTPRCPTARPWDGAAGNHSGLRIADCGLAQGALGASSPFSESPVPSPQSPVPLLQTGPPAPEAGLAGPGEAFDADAQALAEAPPAGPGPMLCSGAAAAKEELGAADGLGPLPPLDPDEQDRILSPLAKDVP